jgi:hypothetical protein
MYGIMCDVCVLKLPMFDAWQLWPYWLLKECSLFAIFCSVKTRGQQKPEQNDRHQACRGMRDGATTCSCRVSNCGAADLGNKGVCWDLYLGLSRHTAWHGSTRLSAPSEVAQ